MYDAPHQFEPLLPASLPAPMANKAADILRLSNSLGAMAHPTALAALRQLLRSMNSYYSNRIEGHSTHPLNIERALRRDFSDRPAIARLQRLALAHIDAERELEAQAASGLTVMHADFLMRAHRALYGRLSEADRWTDDGQPIVPGAWRTLEVTVGRHLSPRADALPRFLARMDAVYGPARDGVAALAAIACAHHRAAWVHPFIDGNGRAIRLQSHCALWPLSRGLWSPNRGLARARDDYYARLHNADLPRRGDLDGRGNLSLAGLLEWVDFFLDICHDQVGFMGRMLELDGMKLRIAALIAFRAAQDKAMRQEAALPLYHVYAAGPVTRGEFARLTGLGQRTARALLSHLLATGLLLSDSRYGPVRFGLPLDALPFLLPGLYPEAAGQPD